MDYQFEQKGIPCLKSVVRQVQNQEQTQEVRLSEEMHDAGQILACWGQILLRGKEWRSDTISCNGGVMVWVLYAPDDGSEPRTLESWIPFQMKWDLRDDAGDGDIRLQCLLRSVDARIVSARKILIRCSVGVLGEAWRQETVNISIPKELPEDVQLRTGRYPVRLPKLAGERAFQVEEELMLPGNMPRQESLIAYTMEVATSDVRVLSGKLAFHGVGHLHLVYRGEDGKIRYWNAEVPISQYAQLDRELTQDAQGDVIPAVTALELEADDAGKLRLKCALLMQYRVDDRELLELVEDAYSTRRELSAQTAELDLPVVLEQKQFPVPVRQMLRLTAGEIADIVYRPDFPQVRRGDEMQVELPGEFQVLYYAEDGTLCGTTARTEEHRGFPSGQTSRPETTVQPGTPASAMLGSGVELQGESKLLLCTMGEKGMGMITGLKTDEITTSAQTRPSLILRRAGNRSLWDIARDSRSTVEQIQKANALETEPEPDRILLIPIS